MGIVQKILIDTNVYSLAMRGNPEIVAVLRTVSSIRLSVVSIGELLSGFRGGRKEKMNRRRLAEFLDTPRVKVHPIDEDTAEFYSVILNQLRKAGRPIPTNDLWIAATALQHGLPLLTKDKHFSKVEGLLLVV